MRVPSVPTAVAVAVTGFCLSVATLSGVGSGLVALPPYLDGTLLRAAPIFLTATVMVTAFNGATFRADWLLVAGPSFAFALHIFVPALGPVRGGAAGIAAGAVITTFVAAAGHATGRGYRELIGENGGDRDGDGTSEDATR
jgi:hypothetical protein